MPAGAHQGPGVDDEPAMPGCCNLASQLTVDDDIVGCDSGHGRHQAPGKFEGIAGVELSNLQWEDWLEAPVPKSFWTAGSSHRGSWCDLWFGGWRMRRI
jgi:hypothetical protein